MVSTKPDFSSFEFTPERKKLLWQLGSQKRMTVKDIQGFSHPNAVRRTLKALEKQKLITNTDGVICLTGNGELAVWMFIGKRGWFI